jgi:hypothetical protein
VGGSINDGSGGIVGELNGAAITNCYAIVGGSINFGSGGIAGQSNNGTITNCYAIVGGSINDGSGGIVGQSNGAAITNCYAIVGGSINNFCGGIAGRLNRGTITNCYVNYTGNPSNIFSPSLPNGSSNNESSATAKWTLEGATHALDSYYSGNAWTNYDKSNNKTPYLLSAFNKAVSSSETVNSATGTIGLTSYGNSLLNGIVSSEQGGEWEYSSSGITYEGLSTGTYPLAIYAYNLLSDLSTFTFTNETQIKTAYNSDAASIYSVVPYMYSNTTNVNIRYIVTNRSAFTFTSDFITTLNSLSESDFNKIFKGIVSAAEWSNGPNNSNGITYIDNSDELQNYFNLQAEENIADALLDLMVNGLDQTKTISALNNIIDNDEQLSLTLLGNSNLISNNTISGTTFGEDIYIEMISNLVNNDFSGATAGSLPDSLNLDTIEEILYYTYKTEYAIDAIKYIYEYYVPPPTNVTYNINNGTKIPNILWDAPINTYGNTISGYKVELIESDTNKTYTITVSTNYLNTDDNTLLIDADNYTYKVKVYTIMAIKMSNETTETDITSIKYAIGSIDIYNPTLLSLIIGDMYDATIPTQSICFPINTKITTDQGIIFIENIIPDKHTINNKRVIAVPQAILLDKNIVCIEKDTLGYNIPSETVKISMEHKIFYKNEMIPAKYFVGKIDGVYNIPYNGEVMYNVLLENYSKMLVNRLIVETLNPDNLIAKLIIKKYTKQERNLIILKLNKCLRKNDIIGYKDICDSIN